MERLPMKQLSIETGAKYRRLCQGKAPIESVAKKRSRVIATPTCDRKDSWDNAGTAVKCEQIGKWSSRDGSNQRFTTLYL